jgi:hypothetical protein
VKELERHILHTAPSYSATDLARVLHYYAAQGLQPGQHATKAVGERLLTLLSKQHGAEAGSVLLPPGFAPRQPCTALPPGFAPQQQGMPLRTLGKLLHLLASLRLEHRGLLPSLLAATWTALEAQEQEILRAKRRRPRCGASWLWWQAVWVGCARAACCSASACLPPLCCRCGAA